MALDIRSLIRTAFIVAFALVMGTQQVCDMLLPWKPFGTYGFSATTFGNIMSVSPGSPAAQAGIEPGDRIDVRNLTYHQHRRIIYLSLSVPGETMTFPVVHGGVTRDVTLTSVVYARTAAENITDIAETLERLVLLAIAVFLALRRPSPLTFSFYLIALSSLGGASLTAWLSDDFMRVQVLVTNAALIAGSCGSVIFAMMFPRLHASRTVVRAAWALTALGGLWWLINTAFAFDITFDWGGTANPAALAAVYRLNALLPALLYAAAVVAFVVNYAGSSAVDRIRMQWVALGFAVGTLGDLGTPLTVTLFGVQPPLWLQNCILSLNIFIPVTVAYAILKHRVVDVRFFLSRALVYSTITGIAVITLVLLEVLVAKQLEQYRLALAIEIAGALALGVGIQRLHKAIDALADRFVFRSVHAAETHLANVGEAMMYARSAAQIDALLSEETARALNLTAVRVVRDAADDDRLALRLQAARTELDEGVDVAVPFIIRHRLYGYARFGPHRNGSAIDPNERDILSKLCHRAAIAYDHVISEERAAENERLRMELDLLKARNDELRNLSRA